MLKLRSGVFNFLFYFELICFLVVGFWFLFTPRSWSMAALKAWSRTALWTLDLVAGTKLEVRGREHIPPAAALVAGKHQSAWDTFGLVPLFRDPALVMKKELFQIPLHGWFSRKFEMIGIDRAAGPKALKDLIAQARLAAGKGRQIVIFPEGTRRPPDAPPDYKPGAAALYTGLGLPCVPFALNSGLYWERRSFLRRPGTIIVEFLPPIPPGLPRREFDARLQQAVEAATARLVAEGRARDGVQKQNEVLS